MADLTPANQNPWYVLMTLYGEQDHPDPAVNRQRAEGSRKVWNAWTCQALGDEERARVCKSARVEVAETLGWADIADEAQERHRDEMKTRNGADFPHTGFPKFDAMIVLSEIEFSNTVVLKNSIFTQ